MIVLRLIFNVMHPIPQAHHLEYGFQTEYKSAYQNFTLALAEESAAFPQHKTDTYRN